VSDGVVVDAACVGSVTHGERASGILLENVGHDPLLGFLLVNNGDCYLSGVVLGR